MKKHNRDRRRMVALASLYKRWGKYQDANSEFWYADYGIPPFAYDEADALLKRLPPEMVAWAKMTS